MQFSANIYEHAASLLGKSPWEVSRDLHLLVTAHVEAHRRYAHTPVVAGIDIYNVEPEAYGAVVECPAETGVPAIRAPLCAAASEIPHLTPLDPQWHGRMPLILTAGEALTKQLPDANVRLPLSGPVTLASQLLGMQKLLLEAFDHREHITAALRFLVRGQIQFCRAAAMRNVAVIVFDSAAAPPLLSPALFRDLALPVLQTLLQETAALYPTPAPLIIGGNTLPILELLLQTGTHTIICPVETDQQRFVAALQHRPEMHVRVNMNPAVFIGDDAAPALREAARVIALARGHGNSCIGTSVLPCNANPAIVLRVRDFVLAQPR